MPRIRSIKPEFWSDAAVASLDILTRLFYIALWNFADDEGRGRAIVRELTGFAFPLDDQVSESDVAASILKLADAGRIILYDVGQVRHFQIVHWSRHQSISHPTRSRTPAPENYRTDTIAPVELPPALPVPVLEPSRNPPGSLPEVSGVGIRKQAVGVFLSGSRQQEAGTREPEEVSECSAAPACLLSDASVDSDLPALCLHACRDVIDEHECAKLLNEGQSPQIVADACQVLRERKAKGKKITNPVGLLRSYVLNEVLAGSLKPAKTVPLRPTGPSRASPVEPPRPRPPEVLEKLKRIGLGSLARSLEEKPGEEQAPDPPPPRRSQSGMHRIGDVIDGAI